MSSAHERKITGGRAFGYKTGGAGRNLTALTSQKPRHSDRFREIQRAASLLPGH
jgi:hypothetical protein